MVEDTDVIVPVDADDSDTHLWDAEAFNSLNRQLRSEDLVPLSRRIREILNYASRLDESALDSERLSNSAAVARRQHASDTALANEDSHLEESQFLLSEDSYDGSKTRVKKASERSFMYLLLLICIFCCFFRLFFVVFINKTFCYTFYGFFL